MAHQVFPVRFEHIAQLVDVDKPIEVRVRTVERRADLRGCRLVLRKPQQQSPCARSISYAAMPAKSHPCALARDGTGPVAPNFSRAAIRFEKSGGCFFMSSATNEYDSLRIARNMFSRQYLRGGQSDCTIASRWSAHEWGHRSAPCTHSSRCTLQSVDQAVQSAVANIGGGRLFVCLTYRQKSEYDTNSIGVTTRFDSYIW
jgi:hypothetical protein